MAMLPNPTDLILRGVTLYVDAVRLALEVPKTTLTLLGLRDNGASDADDVFAVATRIEEEEREQARSATATATAPPPPAAPAAPRVARGHRRERDVQPNGRPRAKDPEPETELVETEGGASPHAQITVDAPWDGYDAMRANQIVARVKTADTAVKAVVRLYEQSHKKRKSILDATAR
jgi:hypothetical protein